MMLLAPICCNIADGCDEPVSVPVVWLVSVSVAGALVYGSPQRPALHGWCLRYDRVGWVW
jgi:hypothetical protein